jgi:hypothetical protein
MLDSSVRQVADELVFEVDKDELMQFDEKNIRYWAYPIYTVAAAGCCGESVVRCLSVTRWRRGGLWLWSGVGAREGMRIHVVFPPRGGSETALRLAACAFPSSCVP